MPLLSPHLDFSDAATATGSTSTAGAALAALPPAGTHLVVSDTLTASSAFVLYHFIGASKVAKVPTIWVDFRAETPASVDAAMRRLGTSLAPSPLFTAVCPSPLPAGLADGPLLFDPSPTLRPTYDAVLSAFSSLPPAPSPSSPAALIILDGLSELVRTGFTPADVTRLVRALRALPGTAIISTLHADHLPKTATEDAIESADDDLLPRLLRLASCWWRVSGLATGRSGDVSGEISCHQLDGEVGPAVPREKPLQFRLEVGGVKVFAKGTGRGFL